MASLTLHDFDFELPENLIAQHPAKERTGSRLLHVAKKGGLGDRKFSDLPELLEPNDLLVFNDTQVIKARFFGAKETGGRVEVMLERILEARKAIAQVRASKPPQKGSRVILEGSFTVEVAGREADFFLLELKEGDFYELAKRHGHLPLPPYITHLPEKEDEARYQTVYARHPGAVAAPTAGLHFDEALLEKLAAFGIRQASITLHVGAGTYQPVRVAQIAKHQMHKEIYNIPEKTAEAIRQTRQRGGRVVAVGTTSLRALESAAYPQKGQKAQESKGLKTGLVKAGRGETDIFITPGYPFLVVDRLITNFHLPKSTLMMLVCAFSGTKAIHQAYEHAIMQAYRFFSYGDAMFLEPQQTEAPCGLLE